MTDTKPLPDPGKEPSIEAHEEEKIPETAENDEKTDELKNSSIKKVHDEKAPLIKKQNIIQKIELSRLEKYDQLDKNNKENREFQGTSDFHGPVDFIQAERRRTDILFIVVFILCNTIYFYYGIYVWSSGVASRLTNGMDFRGEICGIGKLSNLPYLYYASPMIDANVVFCVNQCPLTSGQRICLYDVDPTVTTTFCYTQMQSTYSGRICVPTEPVNKQYVDQDMNSAHNIINRLFGDIIMAPDIIILGLLISIITAWVFWILMKRQNAIKYIVWICIWGTFVCIGCFGYFCYREYQRIILKKCLLGIDKHNCGGQRSYIFWLLCWIFCGIAALYFLIVMKLFNKINLAIGILKATAKCCACLKDIKFLPWLQIIAAFIVGIVIISGITLAFSIGDINVISALNIDGGYVKKIFYNTFIRQVAAFALFMFLWWFEVILLFGDMVISYSLCIWFFTKRKETLKLPAQRIIRDTLKFHVGTLLMLSLLKLILWLPKLALSTTKKVLRKAKQHYTIVRFSQACCMCCIHIFEIFFKYISKHLIVQVSLWADGYFAASKKAYYLLFRHDDNIRDLDFLQVFVLFQNKICCALIGGIFVYIYLNFVPTSPTGKNLSQIETSIGPTVLIFYIGYFYASIFQGTYDIAIKTILQCYLMDEEMFVGEQRFTEEYVTDFMELYKKSLEEKRLDVKIHLEKGGVKQIAAGTKFMAMEEDPDKDENEKIKKQNQESESDSDDSSEEEDEEEPPEDQNENGEGDERPKSREVDPEKGEVRPGSRNKDQSEANSQESDEKSDNSEAKSENSDTQSQDDEEEPESDASGSDEEAPKNIPKGDYDKHNISLSNASDSFKVFSYTGKNPEKPVQKPNASMNQAKGDSQVLFNKSKINNSTIRLDFDDREDKLDYRL